MSARWTSDHSASLICRSSLPRIFHLGQYEVNLKVARKAADAGLFEMHQEADQSADLRGRGSQSGERKGWAKRMLMRTGFPKKSS